MSETQLVKGILDALAAQRVFSWRNNSGVTVLGTGKARRVIRGAPAGSPDILLIVPGSRGQLAGLECKTDTGRQLATQKRWQERAEKHGVRYSVTRSVSHALATVQRWAGEGRK